MSVALRNWRRRCAILTNRCSARRGYEAAGSVHTSPIKGLAAAHDKACSHITGSTPNRTTDWRVPSLLLISFVTIWLALAIAPTHRSDWLMENLLVGIAVPWLVLTRRRMRFSNRAYLCMFVFFVAHAVGAHFTYSLVPYDRWFEILTGTGLNQLLGLQRNHYDRLVHFLYGALLLLPTVELFDRYAPPLGIWRWLMPIFFVTSHSVIYELLEWLAALSVAPSLGEAYLGTQGDLWDAQKDMALASAGATLAMALFAIARGPKRTGGF